MGYGSEHESEVVTKFHSKISSDSFTFLPFYRMKEIDKLERRDVSRREEAVRAGLEFLAPVFLFSHVDPFCNDGDASGNP